VSILGKHILKILAGSDKANVEALKAIAPEIARRVVADVISHTDFPAILTDLHRQQIAEAVTKELQDYFLAHVTHAHSLVEQSKAGAPN
jgi:hypothetical protein